MPYLYRQMIRRQPVTTGLVAINIAALLIVLVQGQTLDAEILFRMGGMSAQAVLVSGEYWRILTAMFLHAGLTHLALNMLLLFFLGGILEPMYGSVWFLVLYLLCGIAGNAASVWYYAMQGPQIVSVGASGAVFGLVGITLVQVIRHGGRFASISLPRLMLMIAVNLYSGHVDGSINNAAHVGGLAMGVLLALLLRKGKR